MNKFVKVSIVCLGIILLVSVFVYFKMFVIGNDNYDDIVIDKVTVGSGKVLVKGKYSDSGRAYKDFSYTQVGNELYITVTSVLVSKKFKSGDFEITIPVNGMEVTDIHLTDGSATKVIYSKQNSLVE